MAKLGELPEAPPLTTMWYVPGAVTPLKAIGYTALYLAFHAPPLVCPTVPLNTLCPCPSTTVKSALATAPVVIRYACLTSVGRYPTWSTRTSPGTAALAVAEWTNAAPASASPAEPRIATTRLEPTERLQLLGKLSYQPGDHRTVGRRRQPP